MSTIGDIISLLKIRDTSVFIYISFIKLEGEVNIKTILLYFRSNKTQAGAVI